LVVAVDLGAGVIAVLSLVTFVCAVSMDPAPASNP
ncbi:MAG: hypothetical protein QOH05_3647, partial [Acetobacteraceae bacterium]|nr:hypothetical protein [Acetobacteraceae bacterium]